MRLIYFIIIVLVCSVPSGAAVNPLGPAYVPAMDANCAHSQYASNIWMTDSLQKVRQDSGSPATNACTLTIRGTQNEFVDFQVHIQAPGGGYSALTVTASNFVQTSPASSTISASTTPPPNIIVYREAYVHIQTYPSNNQLDAAVPGGANFNTYYQGALGYYPDILIPTVDPYWGQTTNAQPFAETAGNNQSFWIDILIPSTSPSGYYLGTITVKNSTTTLATMPVTLAVWQWPSASFMPVTPTLKTEETGWTYGGLCAQMYNPGTIIADQCGTYPGAGGTSDVGVTYQWADASLLMKDHRYNSAFLTNIYPQSGSFATWDTIAGPLMTGSSCNLHGGAATICPILTNSKETTKTIDLLSQIASAAIWSNWQTHFIAQGYGTAGTLPLFDYLCDEPFPEGQGACGAAMASQAFSTIVTNAATRHGYLNPGIPELVTTSMWWGQNSQAAADTYSTTTCGTNTCIGNSIDIMVPVINRLEPMGGPIQPLSTYTTWLAGSTDGIPRQWWSYDTCSSSGTCVDTLVGPGASGYTYVGWPNHHIDGKPAAARVMEWLTYKHGQTGELYYAGDVCAFATVNNYQHCVPSGVAADYDPWNGVYYAGSWGDGTLVYAGGVMAGKINYMGASVTIPLILPSIRLKHMRDGVQDYEYLYKLNSLGYGAISTAQVASWVTNSYTFETSGAGLQAARLALGNMMQTLTYGGSTTTVGVKVTSGMVIK